MSLEPLIGLLAHTHIRADRQTRWKQYHFSLNWLENKFKENNKWTENKIKFKLHCETKKLHPTQSSPIIAIAEAT